MIKDEGQRRHLRVRDDIPVRWYIDRIGVDGKGILRNISISGAMLETKVFVNVEKDFLVMLKAVEPAESIFVPPLARMVWGKTVREGAGYYYYGLEFKDLSSSYETAIGTRIVDKSAGALFGLGSGITDTSWNIR
ncbi:MAG: PilZ domain-containing protein [Candidatus Omnitrophica bacterium]|nr:PilZ domain-containing protein [Candidatus Omnitrophota bacterium]